MKLEKITRDFIKTLTEPQKKRTTAYDSKGIVTRIEDGIAWVKLAGSKIETPLQMTISADPGDEVQARIGNGTGWLTGNGTAPPTDDRMANKSYKVARSADQKAVDAQNAAAEAFKSAEDAAAAAESARTDAGIAHEAALDALRGLAEVEDVVGVLTWFSEHITPTTDTVVAANKVYYEKNGNVYNVVENPTGNPRSQGWYEIDQAITNYIASHLALTDYGLSLVLDNTGYVIHIGTHTSGGANGVYIIDANGKVVGFYGESITIGKEDESRVYIDYHSMQMTYNDETIPYLWISDLRDSNGIAELSETYTGDGSTTTFSVQYGVYQVVSVEVDGRELASSEWSRSYTTFTLNTAPNDYVTFKYETNSEVKIYTLGKRRAGSAVGGYSFAEGVNNIASGAYSHAEGRYNNAAGYCSHAEGYYNEASGSYSHAEGVGNTASGDRSHAEGYGTEATQEESHSEGRDTHATRFCAHAEGYHSEANGHSSHAEGFKTETRGDASHAQNYNTVAAPDYSTALGKWNKEDTKIETFTGDGTTKRFSITELGESVEYLTIDGVEVSIDDYRFSKYTRTDALRFNTAPANGAEIKIKYVLYGNAVVVGNGSSGGARSNALELKWTGDMTIAGQLTQNSDKRLKEHIGYLDEDAADFIRKLRPAHYIKDGDDHVGFYAQDVAMADPWKCMTGKMNGYMTLSYTELIAPLVAYCQSLEKRIEELEKGE